MKWFLVLFSCMVLGRADQQSDCVFRETESGGVCVCNATYCDSIPALIDLKSGQYQLYSTSKTRLGFRAITGTFSTNRGEDATSDATVKIPDLNGTHQTVLGFGGAFTDSAAINILALSEDTRNVLLRNYFGDEGIEYSVGRVPIGGTDFSVRGYTYCDQQDDNLTAFALQEEDLSYKIPLIHQAIELRGKDNIKLFASAWTAPTWMKTTDEYIGKGQIKEEYYALWAKYYLKFFDAYKDNEIDFWGVTTQNEPLNGLVGIPIPNNGFTYKQMVTWIKDYLGPAIRSSDYKDLKIILHDDNRLVLPLLKLEVLSDPDVVRYADGIGLHWYTDMFVPAAILTLAEADEKPLFRLATEACSGYLYLQGLEKAVDLGSWYRADHYGNSIIEDLQYDLVGWVDWNLALNETGGPNWVRNEVDAPIIVNASAGEFYKQPMFYALGHFSKFIKPGSVRIDAEIEGKGLKGIAFVRPDNKLALVLKNSLSDSLEVQIDILGSSVTINLEGHSINTLLYSV